jgi:hypothetical protein
MAGEIGVSYATYRPWENGKDNYAGPTRLQADQLNKALRRLLGDRYADGEAFDVWGWPRERDMSYDQVVELLRSADFGVPRLQANVRPPARVFWVHRVREPNLVHGVFSLAAAAATRAGLLVHLLLDDVALSDRRRNDLCSEFEYRVRTWVAFASGDNAKLTTGLFSSILTHEYLAERGWPAINDYLNSQSSVLDVLRAGKVISPLQYSIDAEESVLALLRNAESLNAGLLLTPLRNWLVFEAEIEVILWDLWHRGCPDDLSVRVQHIFLRPMPMPSYRAAWQEPALSARTNRSMLTTYLINRMASDGHSDLVEWLARAAVHLPASLNPGFRDGLDPMLSDVKALLRAPADQLPRVAGAVAKATVEWLDI